MADVPAGYNYYARSVPERITSGFLHVIVRNDSNDGRDDCVDEYYSHWAEANAPDANAKGSAPFVGTDPGDAPGDPGRTTYKHVIGDYDSYLFFITVAAHLQSHTQAGSAMSGVHDGSNGMTSLSDSTANWVTNGLVDQILHNNTQASSSPISANVSRIISTDDGISWDAGDSYSIKNTSGNIWYTDIPSHTACQNFVRYQLIGRHNNSYGHSGNNYVHYTHNNQWWECASDGLETNPSYENNFIRNTGTIETAFGTDLSTQSNNTYFAPVRGITVSGKHNIEFDSTVTGDFVGGVQHHSITSHPTSFYNLVVAINLHGFTQSGTVAFFRNKINVFFQPFGETTEFEFSTSEFTS